MYMRCIHAGLRSRFDEPNLLTWYFEVLYMVTQMPVSTTTGWAWESSCGVGCAIGALVSFLGISCRFLSYPLPSHLPDFLPLTRVFPRLFLMVYFVRLVLSSAPILCGRGNLT